MLIKKISKITWRFLADFGGVLVTLGMFLSLINSIVLKISVLFKTNLFLFTSFSVGVVITTIFLIRLFKEKIKALVNSVKKETLHEELIPVTSTNHLFNFNKSIPSEKVFNMAKELSFEEALKWSKDAVISTFNFYITKEKEEVDLRIQIYFFSKWKNETMSIYYPSLSTDYKKVAYATNSLDKYFFEILKWKEAVIKAYEKIDSRISNQFHLQISSNVDNSFSINFTFMTGKVEDRVSFTFDGTILLCKEDKSSIAV